MAQPATGREGSCAGASHVGMERCYQGINLEKDFTVIAPQADHYLRCCVHRDVTTVTAWHANVNPRPTVMILYGVARELGADVAVHCWWRAHNEPSPARSVGQ